MAVASAPMQYPAWTAQLLLAMGAPVTPVNQEALSLWYPAEGGLPANNPLNTDGAGPGAVSCIAQCGGSSAIYSYASLDDGIAWNAAWINKNQPGIAAAFKAPNATLGSIWTAINQSGFCRGCNGGKYPSTLWNALSSTAQAGATVGETLAASSGGSGSTAAAATCKTVIPSPLGGALVNSCQAQEVVGALLLLSGGLIMFVGLALLAASMGTGRGLRAAQALPGPAGTTARVAAGQGPQIGAERRRSASRAQAQSDALERVDARGQQSRRSSVGYVEKPF